MRPGRVPGQPTIADLALGSFDPTRKCASRATAAFKIFVDVFLNRRALRAILQRQAVSSARSAPSPACTTQALPPSLMVHPRPHSHKRWPGDAAAIQVIRRGEEGGRADQGARPASPGGEHWRENREERPLRQEGGTAGGTLSPAGNQGEPHEKLLRP